MIKGVVCQEMCEEKSPKVWGTRPLLKLLSASDSPRRGEETIGLLLAICNLLA